MEGPGPDPWGPPWRWGWGETRAEGVGEPFLAPGKAICPAPTSPCPARGPSIQTAHRTQCTLRPHMAKPGVPRPASSPGQSACPQSVQGLSNSLSTEYLRRKIPFFFFFSQEREREGGGSRQRRRRERGREKPTPSLQSRSQASLWGGRRLGAFNLRVQAEETKRLKPEYITALNDLSASIRLNISV